MIPIGVVASSSISASGGTVPSQITSFVITSASGGSVLNYSFTAPYNGGSPITGYYVYTTNYDYDLSDYVIYDERFTQSGTIAANVGGLGAIYFYAINAIGNGLENSRNLNTF
jgi:hypothetical protein